MVSLIETVGGVSGCGSRGLNTFYADFPCFQLIPFELRSLYDGQKLRIDAEDVRIKE